MGEVAEHMVSTGHCRRMRRRTTDRGGWCGGKLYVNIVEAIQIVGSARKFGWEEPWRSQERELDNFGFD